MDKILSFILCLLFSGIALAAEPDGTDSECKKQLLYETTGFLEDLGLLNMKKDAGRLKVELLERHKIGTIDHKGTEAAKLFPNGIQTVYQNIHRITATNTKGERIEMMTFAEGDNNMCPGLMQIVLLTSPVVIQLNFMDKDKPHSTLDSYRVRWEKYKKEIERWPKTRID